MNRSLLTALSIIIILCAGILPAQVIKSPEETAEIITDGDEPEFTQAMEYISQNRPADVVPFLKNEYMDDDDFETRMRIISALKLYPPREYSDVWIALLSNTEDKRIEIELIDFLGVAENNPFVIPIAEKITVPRTEVRAKAAQVLALIRDDKMMPVILSMGNSANPVHRIYFLESLNYIYDIRFQKTVISLLGDSNKSVRIYAIESVMKNDIKEALQDLKGIIKNEPNYEVKIKALDAVVQFRDTGSGSLIVALLDENERELRLASVKALAELRYTQAARQISRLLLTENDNEIKDVALDALYTLKKSGELEGLEFILKKDKKTSLRIKAAFIIGELKDDSKAVEILEAGLTDEDYRVRGEICNSLGNFRKGKSTDILFNSISTDTSRYVRTSALYSIVRINDPKNIVRLFDVYSCEKDMVFRMLLHDIIRAGIEKNIR